MEDPKKAWDEVGSRFADLGLKLKLHLQEQLSEGNTSEVRDALHKLGDTLDSAFTALGNAARDEAVQQDVKEAASSLADALSDTFTDVGDAIHEAFTKKSAKPS